MFVTVSGAWSMIDLIVWERIDFTLGNDFNQVTRGFAIVFGGLFVLCFVGLFVVCFKYSLGICNARLRLVVFSGVSNCPVIYSFPWKLLWILAFKSTVDGCCLNDLSLASVSWSGFAIVNVKWFRGVIMVDGEV